MSRVGQNPITIPENVKISIDGQRITVEGPKGKMDWAFHPEMRLKRVDGSLVVERATNSRVHRSLHGLTRTLIANMIEGVTRGFQKALELKGTGYRASKSGEKLVLSVGYSRPVEIVPPADIQIEVPSPTSVVVSGIDKQKVGEVAAKIRAVREPEPYLGKGIRYAGEKVRQKEGKAGK